MFVKGKLIVFTFDWLDVQFAAQCFVYDPHMVIAMKKVIESVLNREKDKMHIDLLVLHVIIADIFV